METGEYQATWGAIKNPKSKDGKWTYLKLIPQVRLINENGTLINRQDYTFGVIQDGAP